MILRINAASVIANMPQNRIKKQELKENNGVTNPNNDEISGVPKSYVMFRAKKEDKHIQFTDEAKVLIDKANAIAAQHGHSNLSPAHVIQASIDMTIENLELFPEELLDSGSVDSVSPLNKIVNEKAGKNMIANPQARGFFVTMMDILKEENANYLAEIPSKKNIDASKITMEEDFEAALKETEKQARAINPYMLLGVAMNTYTGKGITYPSEFLKGIISYGLYKSGEEIQKNYVNVYDTRAIDVWNKLALGSNLNITYEHPKEADRLIASIVNTLDSPKYGGFNSENTQVFAMSDNIIDIQFFEELQEQKEGNPDAKKIFILDMDKLLASTVNESGEISYNNGIIQALQNTDENLQLVIMQSNDTYYKMVKEPSLQSLYSNFVTYSIPPIQTYEARNLITKDTMKAIPTPYTKDGISRAIFHAANMQGVFPDKAVDLMKRIAIYYGESKKKIAGKDVDEFAQIGHELFNKKNSKVVYDTGKTLEDMYGKETIKKDIEAIVKQIRTGRIGTRGMVIYSKDAETGSGRRFAAETIAGEAKIPFISINTSDFAVSERDSEGVSIETPKNAMSRVFLEAKKAARQNPYKTAVVYVNNFEEFAFSGPYLPGYKQAMAQLSEEMKTAVEEDVNILVIGSTDEYYAEAISDVVGGFNQMLVVDSPAFNKQAREEIIKHRIEETGLQLNYKKLEDKQKLINKLVKITAYMSFVELKSFIDKTRQIMFERAKNKASIGDFIEAYLQLTTGRTSHPGMPDFNKAATTSHECGHATNLEVMNDILRRRGKPWHKSNDVNFITLDPRGNFLGAVFEGKEDNTDYPFEAMFTALVCSYGGYSCEKMFFGMDGSAGISQDLAQATAAVKRGIEYFGLGFNTGKISNAVGLKSAKFYESVFEDMEVILSNAQVASDLITECYKEFNVWFTKKYSKLIGSNNCLVDGEDFRAALKNWQKTLSKGKREEIQIMEEIIMDLISSSKNGKKYATVVKKVL